MLTALRRLPCLVALLATGSQSVLAQNTRTPEELLLAIAERDALIEDLRAEVTRLEARLIIAAGAADSALERPPSPSGDDSPQLVVDEVAAERALERTLVQSGALLLPRGALELVPSLAAGVSTLDFPVEVNTETGVALGAMELERTESALGLTARIGLPLDSQLEIAFPYRNVTEESLVSAAGMPAVESKRTGRGKGDWTLGFAKTLLRETDGARPDIVGRLTWASGEGRGVDDGVALGSGFESWTASLSFVKRLDPLALFGSIAYTDTQTEGRITPGEELSASFGTALAVTPHSSLFGSIVHRAISSTKLNDEPLAASDLDVTTLSLGFSTTLRRGTLLNLYSEIGLSSEAPDYSLAFTLPTRVR